MFIIDETIKKHIANIKQMMDNAGCTGKWNHDTKTNHGCIGLSEDHILSFPIQVEFEEMMKYISINVISGPDEIWELAEIVEHISKESPIIQRLFTGALMTETHQAQHAAGIAGLDTDTSPLLKVMAKLLGATVSKITPEELAAKLEDAEAEETLKDILNSSDKPNKPDTPDDGSHLH